MTEPRRVIARGWATVDIDRAAGELSDWVARGEFVEAPRSSWLGARCLRARARDATGGEWVVLLEPDTEGRLAAFLARHGEGWAATWAAAGDTELAGSRPGPLGPETLGQAQPMSGPFRLRTTAATIEP